MTRTNVEPLAIGTRVTYPYFGHNLTGIVTRDSGSGIVWLRDPEGRRERWMHRDSLTVLDTAR